MYDTKDVKKEIISQLKTETRICNDREIALYIHIPFCVKKCNYCSFISFCNKTRSQMDEYVDCLIKELQTRKVDATIKSIYIGGGTPSLLTVNQITKIMNAIYNIYAVNDNAEITIEVNPNSITEEKLIAYNELNINRISVGIQSMNNRCLKQLGRAHTRKQAIDSLKLIKKYGFTNVNCDLIVGLKRLNTNFSFIINQLKKYVTHFSIYSIMIEENTPFFVEYQNGKLKVYDEKRSARQISKITKILKKKGYDRYEVSNYSKQNYKSIHNLTYWTMGEYLGVGVASHSFINNERIAVTEDFDLYIDSIKNNKNCLTIEHIAIDELKEETIMLALRTSKGLDLLNYKKTFNEDLLKIKKNEITLLNSLGLIEIDENHLQATDKGFLVLNQIILQLVI